MNIHFLRELERLKEHLLRLSARVEQAVAEAMHSVEARDQVLAKRVMAYDKEIDRTEVDLEEECLKVLALHQPVAGDLRFVISVLKINNDIERIADLAGHIAAQAAHLAVQPPRALPPNLPKMAKAAREMLRMSLDALVNLDSGTAKAVLQADDQVDTWHRETFQWCQCALQANATEPDYPIRCMSISRHLERIADHATNIAEDVLYMLEGEIVRHRHE
jgi:phosphate transport system protein